MPKVNTASPEICAHALQQAALQEARFFASAAGFSSAEPLPPRLL